MHSSSLSFLPHLWNTNWQPTVHRWLWILWIVCSVFPFLLPWKAAEKLGGRRDLCSGAGVQRCSWKDDTLEDGNTDAPRVEFPAPEFSSPAERETDNSIHPQIQSLTGEGRTQAMAEFGVGDVSDFFIFEFLGRHGFSVRSDGISWIFWFLGFGFLGSGLEKSRVDQLGETDVSFFGFRRQVDRSQPELHPCVRGRKGRTWVQHPKKDKKKNDGTWEQTWVPNVGGWGGAQCSGLTSHISGHDPSDFLEDRNVWRKWSLSPADGRT